MNSAWFICMGLSGHTHTEHQRRTVNTYSSKGQNANSRKYSDTKIDTTIGSLTVGTLTHTRTGVKASETGNLKFKIWSRSSQAAKTLLLQFQTCPEGDTGESPCTHLRSGSWGPRAGCRTATWVRGRSWRSPGVGLWGKCAIAEAGCIEGTSSPWSGSHTSQPWSPGRRTCPWSMRALFQSLHKHTHNCTNYEVSENP